MNRPNAPETQHPPKPAARRLALKRETLRRLTPTELRLAAGGFRSCGSECVRL